MQTRNRILLSLLLASLVPTCGPVDSEKMGIPDDAIGLSKVDLRDTSTPEPIPLNSSDPGEQPTLTPAYTGSPPVVPHAIDDFLPITRDENMCIDCHQVDEKIAGEATPIPASHFVDLRSAPDRRRDEIAGARYNCTSCHVLHRDAQPLVQNEFNGEE